MSDCPVQDQDEQWDGKTDLKTDSPFENDKYDTIDEDGYDPN